MNIVICGSRNFNDYHYFKNEMDIHLYPLENFTLVSGGAKGADTFARDYAEKHAYPFKEYLAKWDEHGKKAGILRNLEMLEIADQVVAFWDGKSRGTSHMIEQCLSRNIPITVFEV